MALNCRVLMRDKREKEQASRWETQLKTTEKCVRTVRPCLVTVAMAPGGHFGHSVLQGCGPGSYSVFHHDPLEHFSGPSCSFRESTLVMFASDRDVYMCVSVCVCECVGFFSNRQQEGLTDCVWEVGGRNSRGLNYVSLSNTHLYAHSHAHKHEIHIHNLGRWLKEWVVHTANSQYFFWSDHKHNTICPWMASMGSFLFESVRWQTSACSFWLFPMGDNFKSCLGKCVRVTVYLKLTRGSISH